MITYFDGSEWAYDHVNQCVVAARDRHKVILDLRHFGTSEQERTLFGQRVARMPLMERVLDDLRELIEGCWDHTKDGKRITGDNPRSCSDVNDDLLGYDREVHLALGTGVPEEIPWSEDLEVDE